MPGRPAARVSMAATTPDPDRIPPLEGGETLAARPSREELELPDLRALEAEAEAASGPRAGEADDGRLTLAAFLRKFTEVALLASFLGAVLSYHFFVPGAWQHRMESAIAGLNGGFELRAGDLHPDRWLAMLLGDFVPAISNGLPVLELKSTAWLLTGLIVILAHLVSRLYERMFHIEVFPADLAAARREGVDWRRLIPLLAIAAFLLWTFLSFSRFGWGPAPPVEAEIQPGGGVGGSFHSLIAWIQVALALLFYIVAEDIFRTRTTVKKILGLFIALGFVAALTATLVHVGLPPLEAVWIRFGEGDYRNDVAGFLGHNTAMSSFLIAPMLLSWTLLLSNRDRYPYWAKAALVTNIVLMALCLLLAQSRAVIPILGVAFAVMLIGFRVRAAITPGPAFWVSVPLVLTVLVLTQLVAHPGNPLYRRNLPLVSRIGHLSFEHLKTETRLRVLVCSLPVIANHPLRGTGWATFQYVYPAAQGEYYKKNPGSEIAPTSNRSMHAHNEYLQTLMEAGGAGLGIGLAGLLTVLIGGLKALRSCLDQRNVALQISIVVSIVALLGHAAFDFPLRVAPLACSLVLLLAIWSAGDRLWLIPARPVTQRPGGAAPGKAGTESAGAPVSKLRLAAVAWLVATMLSVLAVSAAAAKVGDWFAVRVLEIRMANSVASYFDRGQREPKLLEDADRAGGHGTKILPLDGEINYRYAHVLQLEANMLNRSMQAAQGGATGGELDPERYKIAMLAERGLHLLDQSLNEVHFHGSYKTRSGLNLALANVSTGPRQELFRRQGVADLRRAVEMNPGDPDSVNTLIAILGRFKAGDSESVLKLRKLLYHFHRPYFETTVLRDFQEARYLLEHQRALEMIRDIRKVDPANVNYLFMEAMTAYNTGDVREAARLNAQVLADLPRESASLQALLAIREGSPERAIRSLSRLYADNPALRQHYEILTLLLQSRMGTESPGDQDRRREAQQRLESLTASSHQACVQTALYLLQDFDDSASAEKYICQRFTFEKIPPTIQDHVILASALLRRQRDDYDDLLARRAAALEAGAPLPAAQDKPLRDAIAAALAEYRAAAELASLPIHAELIAARAAELEALLGVGEPPLVQP
ncbi:O-antigen ligase family protein [Candidatus Poribacteria bacterium]|nr:O-antigen ligase family protein [Candidatus Poribacteria bacterium]